MKLRKWLDIRTPLFVIGMMALLVVTFAIGLAVDRMVKIYREKRIPLLEFQKK